MENKTYIIKAGKLYDGKLDELQENKEILVVGEKIEEVSTKVTAVPGAEIIDLSDATVTPGLSDTHVHFGFGEWRTKNHDTIYDAPIYHGMYALHNAKKALARGFTTVRHCGSNCDDDYSIVVAKRLIEDGLFEGARMKVAPHFVGATYGHGDSSKLIMTNPKLADYIWSQYPGAASGPDEFAEVVRKQVKFGADFIKLFCSGGFNSETDGPEDYCLTDEEMKSVIDVSHMMHMKVTSHTYGPDLVKKQIGLGIDGIEHGALIKDPALLDEMVEKGVYLVPTFTPFTSVIQLDEERLKQNSPGMQRKLRYYRDWLAEAREVVVKHDIPLGYGTDLVAMHYPYESGWEFYNMVTSGVSPFRALAGATRVNAQIMDMDNCIGALAPGYFADIAAWKRDLMTDPKALLDCAFSMKGGKVYKTEADV